jgi:hypothetical protein
MARKRNSKHNKSYNRAALIGELLRAAPTKRFSLKTLTEASGGGRNCHCHRRFLLFRQVRPDGRPN